MNPAYSLRSQTLTWGGENLVRFPLHLVANMPRISWHVYWLSDEWREVPGCLFGHTV